jgi:hypothetical protein
MVGIYKNISKGSTASIFNVEEQANKLARSKQLKACLAYCPTLKMQAVSLSEVSVSSHQIKRCHIPENNTFHEN